MYTIRIAAPRVTLVGMAALMLAFAWIGPSRAAEENAGAAAYRRGMSLLKKGMTDGAIAQFTILVSYDPKDPVAYCYRADAYARNQDWKHALRDAKTAVQMDEDLAWAYVLRGQAYAGLYKHGEAMADFAKAISLDPKFNRAYIQRGHLYAKLGQAEKANQDFRVANRLIIQQAGGQPSTQLR